MSLELQIGTWVQLPAGHRPIEACVEHLVEVAGGRIVVLRRGLGDVQRWVYCQREDGTVIDVPALANTILAGRPVREPVAAVEQILAGAVLALTDIAVADCDEEV